MTGAYSACTATPLLASVISEIFWAGSRETQAGLAFFSRSIRTLAVAGCRLCGGSIGGVWPTPKISPPAALTSIAVAGQLGSEMQAELSKGAEVEVEAVHPGRVGNQLTVDDNQQTGWIWGRTHALACKQPGGSRFGGSFPLAGYAREEIVANQRVTATREIFEPRRS